MVFQKVTFDRLFPAALSGTGLMKYTSFGFEAAGKRYFSVKVPGRPRIDQGMTVIALLETPNGLREDNGLLGWVDCRDGSPPRQNSCRPDRIDEQGAMMEERIGSIRTGIQG